MAQKQRVVIIGGSSGMGFQIANEMHKLSYEVLIASRSKEKLEKAREAIGKIETRVLDARNEKEIIHFFSQVGPFDHLVTSAADFYLGPFLTGKTEDAKGYFESKFWGQYCAAKHGAPHIRKGGSILLFSGSANQKPMPHFAAGCAINAAIESLARCLALELAPIRVNAISPGVIVTPLWDTTPEKERNALFTATGKKLPVGRVGKPAEIALAARFLIECGYATGTTVHVDGGFPLV